MKDRTTECSTRAVKRNITQLNQNEKTMSVKIRAKPWQEI